MILPTTIAVLLSFGGSCDATTFGEPGDPWAGGPSGCYGRPLEEMPWGVAHRDLPCGTRLLLINPRNGRSTRAVVVDRGPYAAHVGASRVMLVKMKHDDPGRWRACLDLLPGVTRQLGHDGFERVTFIRLD